MQTQHEFVISPDADSLVSALSGDFGDYILSRAVTLAAKRGENIAEVKREDVVAALAWICDMLEKAHASGSLGDDAIESINTLRSLCNRMAPGSSGK
jgi:hypothetical protein